MLGGMRRLEHPRSRILVIQGLRKTVLWTTEPRTLDENSRKYDCHLHQGQAHSGYSHGSSQLTMGAARYNAMPSNPRSTVSKQNVTVRVVARTLASPSSLAKTHTRRLQRIRRSERELRGQLAKRGIL